jgi:predicted DCC family thiol-disulfide oxidoreductase YuxK
MATPLVLIYDVDCAFCQRSVRLLARLDRDERFRFSTRAAAYGRGTLEAHPWLREVDSLILVAPDTGDVYVRSDAVIHATIELGGAWRLFKAALLVPRPLRDVVYKIVAKVRRRLARDVCLTGPGTDELRARTLP